MARWQLLVLCAGLFGISNIHANAQVPPVASTRPAFDSIVQPLSESVKRSDALRKELANAPAEDARKEIQERLANELERATGFRKNLADIIGGAEAADYNGVSAGNTNLQEQITDLLQPILGEVRDATSRPRELDVLHKSLDLWNERQRKAGTIVARIDDLSLANSNAVLKDELQSAREVWTGRQAEAEGQITVLKARIADREGERESLFDTFSNGFSRFFRSRGLNLLLAIATAVAGFMVTRRVYLWLRRITRGKRAGQRSLRGRISDLLSIAVAGVVAFFGVILVFYARGDWLLLTLVLVMMIGIAWAGKTAVLPYIEQLKMLLNLGSVREGERVVHLGLPWKVGRIGVFTKFTNPNLQGGGLRIPIRDLMLMTSRDADAKEPWFPTEPDDWALLSDRTYGKVVTQTPEQVVFLQLGGTLKTYPTNDFLSLAPARLSGGFRVSCTFGIDYQHQSEATGKIAELFGLALRKDLVGEFGREWVRSVKVEFAAAAVSSLDYQILADFDGCLAPKYKALQRRIQRVCVDTCNVHGWNIPFTQITVHQAVGKAISAA